MNLICFLVPQLNAADKDFFEKCIQPSEITLAIDSLQLNKAPGVGSFTAVFLKN